jgi:hypothetical protein
VAAAGDRGWQTRRSMQSRGGGEVVWLILGTRGGRARRLGGGAQRAASRWRSKGQWR